MTNLVDTARLVSRSTLSAVTYLDGSGWQLIGRASGDSLWRLRGEDREWEVILPIDPSNIDAARRTGETLSALSKIEQRSIDDIAKDIVTSGSDIIRVKTEPTSPSGSAPLSEALTILHASRDAVEAAASTVDRPRAVLGPRKPINATEYANSIQVMTEPGSFVVALSSPVSAITPGPIAELAADLENGMLFDSAVPFSRRASIRLMEAVTKALSLGEAVRDGNTEAQEFDSAVPSGVSANLLESLVRLGTFTESPETLGVTRRQFSISVRWAYTRPRPANVASELIVSRDAIFTFEQAASSFRRRLPQPDTELLGELVGNLDSDAGDGIAIMRTFIATSGSDRARWRKVRIPLNDVLYETARRAHHARLQVRAVGDLSTSGRLTMSNVSDFSIVEDSEPDENEPTAD